MSNRNRKFRRRVRARMEKTGENYAAAHRNLSKADTHEKSLKENSVRPVTPRFATIEDLRSHRISDPGAQLTHSVSLPLVALDNFESLFARVRKAVEPPTLSTGFLRQFDFITQQFSQQKMILEHGLAFRVTLALQAAEIRNLAAMVKNTLMVPPPTLVVSKALEDLLDRQISDLGAQLTHSLSLPLAALEDFSVKAAADFESYFAGVRKTALKATEEQFARLSKAAMPDFNDFAAAARRMLNSATGVGS